LRKLYVVGLGPGDPELITVKGLNRLREAEVVFIPMSSKVDDSIALSIVEKISIASKVIKLSVSMGDKTWVEKVAREVCNALHKFSCIAIAVLGEPSLYSTSAHLLASMKCLDDVYIEIVPGVSAIYACADRVLMPLALGDEAIAIVPSARVEALGDVVGYFNTVVVVKGGKIMAKAAESLAQKGFRIVYAKRCFTEDEVIGRDIIDEDYISLVIARR